MKKEYTNIWAIQINTILKYNSFVIQSDKVLFIVIVIYSDLEKTTKSELVD